MSGRARQKPPKDALRFPSPHEWPRGADEKTGNAILDELLDLYKWIEANGFPYFIPEDPVLWISRDGRTLYGTRTYARIGESGSYRTRRRAPLRWDVELTPDGTDLRTRTFAYPIVRSLWDYAPNLAAYMGLRPRYVSISVEVDLGEPPGKPCPSCGSSAAVWIVAARPIGSHRLGRACARCLTAYSR